MKVFLLFALMLSLGAGCKRSSSSKDPSNNDGQNSPTDDTTTATDTTTNNDALLPDALQGNASDVIIIDVSSLNLSSFEYQIRDTTADSCLNAAQTALDQTCPSFHEGTLDSGSFSFSAASFTHARTMELTLRYTNDNGETVQVIDTFLYKKPEKTLLFEIVYDAGNGDKQDVFRDVVVDHDLDIVYAMGFSEDYVSGTSNIDTIVLRYRLDGTAYADGTWSSPFAMDVSSANNYGHSLAIDSQGRYIFTGVTNVDTDARFRMYNSDQSLFANSDPTPDSNQTHNGLVIYEGFAYVSGSQLNAAAGGSGRDFIVRKYDITDGAEVTTGGFPLAYARDTGSNELDQGMDLAVDASGIYLWGVEDKAGGDTGLRLLKFELDGTPAWGGTGVLLAGEAELGNEILTSHMPVTVSDTHVYAAGWVSNQVSGTSGRDFKIFKVSKTDGSVEAPWTYLWGDEDEDQIRTLAWHQDTRTLFVGGHISNDANGSSAEDWVVLRLREDGSTEPFWSISENFNNDNDKLNKIFIDAIGDIWIAGYGTDIVGGSTNRDAVLRRYSGPTP